MPRHLDITEITPKASHQLARAIAEEAPVSLMFNGVSYVVMMATPMDLEDFGRGFAVSEAVVEKSADIKDIRVAEVEAGWVVDVSVPQTALDQLLKRRRNMVGQSGCGLCGIEDLEAALRPLVAIEKTPAVTKDVLFKALSNLPQHQVMNAETGAMHAAAFFDKNGAMIAVREDVGRHTALDKLVGGMCHGQQAFDQGFLVMSSRCSYELVQKAITVGIGLMVTISAPTTLAVALAKQYGLCLVCLARDDSMLVLNDPTKQY